MPRSDIPWALAEFRDTHRLTRYDLARSYYLGDHRMAFATNRFRSIFGALFQTVADNLCPAVVDSVADRLEIHGVTSNQAVSDERMGAMGRERINISDPLATAAWALWQRNMMPLRATEVHREALLTGDGYVIVWPDENGETAIWPQKAHEVAVRYSDTVPGVVDMAAKLWKRPDKRLQLNLFYPDRIEKYVTRTQAQSGLAESTRPAAFVPVDYPHGTTLSGATDQFDGAAAAPNPYGRVPVFHFPNKRMWSYGLSELLDVVPLQDGLNKSLCDMIVAMEYSAYRQRWATGLDVEVDEETGKPKQVPFDYGPDRFVASSDADTRFGEFGTTDLSQFLQVQESFRSEIARVSGTPLHYLFITRGDFPSGEAMKSAEARFTRKLNDRQAAFGAVWADVLEFALGVDGEDVPEGLELAAAWDPPQPSSQFEIAQTLAVKQTLGVSRSQILRELGYTEEQIDLMLSETAASGDAAPPLQVQPPPPPGVTPGVTTKASPGSIRTPAGREATA